MRLLVCNLILATLFGFASSGSEKALAHNYIFFGRDSNPKERDFLFKFKIQPSPPTTSLYRNIFVRTRGIMAESLRSTMVGIRGDG